MKEINHICWYSAEESGEIILHWNPIIPTPNASYHYERTEEMYD